MDDAKAKSRWIACQFGAREHYAVPRALLEAGRLDALCTDVWAGSWLRLARRLPMRRATALAARHHPGIPISKVRHWSLRALRRELNGRGRQLDSYQRFLADGRWFGGLARGWLDSLTRHPEILFSYDTTALEVFEWGRERGLRCVLGQMDPGRFEADLVAHERDRWPGWEPQASPVPEAYHERRAAEWRLADTIIVNSRWSRDALIQQGVPEAKLQVIPLVYEPPESPPLEGISAKCRGPLKLLFLGQVNLRKGIPYLLEAARLAGAAVEVTIVGPIQISRDAVASAPSNVRFTGPVSRSEVAEHYRRADAFLLPTLSDGFAITQLEAMAHGLPVIATPHCGEVVTDGVDGRIVPAGDSPRLAAAIMALATDATLLHKMSLQASLKSKSFTLNHLVKALAAL